MASCHGHLVVWSFITIVLNGKEWHELHIESATKAKHSIKTCKAHTIPDSASAILISAANAKQTKPSQVCKIKLWQCTVDLIPSAKAAGRDSSVYCKA